MKDTTHELVGCATTAACIELRLAREELHSAIGGVPGVHKTIDGNNTYSVSGKVLMILQNRLERTQRYVNAIDAVLLEESP